MKKRVAAGAAGLLLLLVACTGEDDPNAACTQALDREQNEVGTRAVADVATAAATIEGVLERQQNGRLAPGEQRLLGEIQGRLRTLSHDLEEAFNTGCM